MTYYYKSKKQFPVTLLFSSSEAVLISYIEDGKTVWKTYTATFFNANFTETYDIVKAWNTANQLIAQIGTDIDDLKPNSAKNKLQELTTILTDIYLDLPKEWQDVEVKEKKGKK